MLRESTQPSPTRAIVKGPAAERLLGELRESLPVRAGLVGESPAVERLVENVLRLARSRLPVLVLGEVGSGKESVARALHLNSPHSNSRFVAESCAHLREPFLLGRLFGHERGAFTGAHTASAGLFELADGGTLFLDEIRDLSLAAQACLVRVLDQGEYRPLGNAEIRRSEFRLVASTAFDVKSLVRSGLLRPDLYFRLRGAIVQVPPLRERKEDILHLAEQVLLEAARQERRAPNLLASDARGALLSHRWPGNVRELRHEMAHALLVAERGEITADMFTFLRDPPPDSDRVEVRGAEPPPRRTLRRDIGEFEDSTIRDALRLAGGNKAEAARRLGITRRTLYRRLRRFDDPLRPTRRESAGVMHRDRIRDCVADEPDTSRTQPAQGAADDRVDFD